MTNDNRAGSAITDFAARFGLTLMNQAQATLSPELRELHRAILSAFVGTGTAPTVAWITDRASLLGADPDDALASLSEADLVHTADGSVTVAYPFSGTPTPHRVEFDGGPTTWAMCGADALGIPLMTGRNAAITSADPQTGELIRIRYHNRVWTWEPDSTVMLTAATRGCGTAAEAACRYVHFFTRPEHAQLYLETNPALSGEVYDQADSIEASRIIFGSLLGR
ncbi:alkylmercury lyase family protein [Kribbella catacumbae]|uniref:alkylmercury lyase family protein n=1 Tax=Kribbella catacumbae TaxID=460086 RepID=UPI00037D5EBE|nr:alkylmercury lyase family protein [Kribbella catacumbae]